MNFVILYCPGTLHSLLAWFIVSIGFVRFVYIRQRCVTAFSCSLCEAMCVKIVIFSSKSAA